MSRKTRIAKKHTKSDEKKENENSAHLIIGNYYVEKQMKLKRENKILSKSINFTIKTAQSEKKMIRTTGFLMDA